MFRDGGVSPPAVGAGPRARRQRQSPELRLPVFRQRPATFRSVRHSRQVLSRSRWQSTDEGASNRGWMFTRHKQNVALRSSDFTRDVLSIIGEVARWAFHQKQGSIDLQVPMR